MAEAVLVVLMIEVGVAFLLSQLLPLHKIMACFYDNKNMNIAWHIIQVSTMDNFSLFFANFGWREFYKSKRPHEKV